MPRLTAFARDIIDFAPSQWVSVNATRKILDPIAIVFPRVDARLVLPPGG